MICSSPRRQTILTRRNTGILDESMSEMCLVEIPRFRSNLSQTQGAIEQAESFAESQQGSLALKRHAKPLSCQAVCVHTGVPGGIQNLLNYRNFLTVLEQIDEIVSKRQKLWHNLCLANPLNQPCLDSPCPQGETRQLSQEVLE